MRKNSSKLITALILAALMAVTAFFAGNKLKDSLVLDLQYGDGNKAVYTVDSADETVIKETADILEKRIINFGATGTKTEIDGKNVTVYFTGVEDTETMRKYLTQTGKLTVRDSSDKLLFDESILGKGAPIIIMQGENESINIYVNVADGEKMKEITTAQLSAEDKTMVFWYDFEEGTNSYSKNKDQKDGKIIGDPTLNSAFDASYYFQTTLQSKESALNIARTLAGGTLTAAVTETAFEPFTAEAGTNALQKSLTALWVCVLLAAAYLVFKYRLPGFVTGALAAVHMLAFFRSNQLLSVPYNGVQIAAYVVALATGLWLITYVYEHFIENVRKGRNLQTSLSLAYGDKLYSISEICITCIIVGALGYAFFRSTLASKAIALVFGAVCNLLFFVIFNKLILTNLVESGYCENKSLYGVREEDLPDVQKGEAYTKTTAGYDFSKLLSGSVIYIVLAVLAVCGLALALSLPADLRKEASNAMLLAGIIIVLAIAYTHYRYKDSFIVGVVVAIAVSGCAALAVYGLLNKDAVGYVILFVGLAGGLAFTVSSAIRKQFRGIAHEKMNEEKLNRTVNSVLNDLMPANIVAVAVSVILGIAVMVLAKVRAEAGVIAFILTIAVTCLTGAKMWHENLKSTIGRKPAKKKKTNKKELKETTIFGLNEVK